MGSLRVATPSPWLEDVRVIFPKHHDQIDKNGRPKSQKGQINEAETHTVGTYTHTFS